MLRIKRTKRASNPGGQPVGPEIAHYATAVTPRGTVEGWDADPARAVAVTEGIAKRVREFHRGRKNVGELTFEPTQVTAADLARAVAAEDAVGAEAFTKLQEECRRLLAENGELRKMADEAGAAAGAANQRARDAAAQLASLQADFTAQGDQVAMLTARVAELEALLAAAQKADRPKKEAPK